MKTKSLVLLAALFVLAMALTSCCLITNEHTWVEATCDEPKTCSVCHMTEGEALGHNVEIIPKVDQTCSASGLTEGKKCSVCGEIFEEQKELKPLPHTSISVPAVAPTCEKIGYTEGRKCSICDEIIEGHEEIPALGHTDSDSNGRCDVCNVSLCETHSPMEAVKENEKATSCTEAGSYDSVVKCSVCNEELSRETITIDILPHSEEIVAGKEASCTEAGITDGKKCSVCGTILVEQEEIPATGHIFTDGSCKCGLIANLFAGKQFVASSDAAANIYSSNFGYKTLTDGIVYEEGTGRFSSKQNGGKVEATIDLGSVYDLGELKVYLYWKGLDNLGTGFEIQVLFGGEWTSVVKCESIEDMQKYWVDNPDSVDKDWLVFDLGNVPARQVKFTIPAQTESGWTTLYEIECSGKVSSAVEPEVEPELIENVFAGKNFVPTDDAVSSTLSASWWKGSGYEGLTDGIKNADNAPGRFSTIMATSGMMDATIDLGGAYKLESLKFHIYEVGARTEAQIKGSIGADIIIQVYANGEWIDVISCADNAALYGHLVSNEGLNNDYLEFDMDGITAEKVRFCISASASGSGTTYQEIECSGYAS